MASMLIAGPSIPGKRRPSSSSFLFAMNALRIWTPELRTFETLESPPLRSWRIRIAAETSSRCTATWQVSGPGRRKFSVELWRVASWPGQRCRRRSLSCEPRGA